MFDIQKEHQSDDSKNHKLFSKLEKKKTDIIITRSSLKRQDSQHIKSFKTVSFDQ